MANFTEPADGRLPALSRATKLWIIAAVLLGCTLVIGVSVFRDLGGPTAEELAARARETAQTRVEALANQPGNIVWRKQTAENMVGAHTLALARLNEALGPQPASRCTPEIRRTLRWTLENYVESRANAVRLSIHEPIAKDLGLDKIWETDEDAKALADARSLLNQGYLVASEFESWSDDEDTILPLPRGVASACSRPIDAVDPVANSQPH